MFTVGSYWFELWQFNGWAPAKPWSWEGTCVSSAHGQNGWDVQLRFVKTVGGHPMAMSQKWFKTLTSLKIAGWSWMFIPQIPCKYPANTMQIPCKYHANTMVSLCFIMFHTFIFSTSPKWRFFMGKKVIDHGMEWGAMGCHGIPVCGKNRSPTWDFFEHQIEPFLGQQLQL